MQVACASVTPDCGSPHPENPDGIKVEVPARSTLWGRIEFALWVSPPDARRRRVAVVGRAGTTIVDDIAEIEEFAVPPWTTGQVGGQVVFAALQQTADDELSCVTATRSRSSWTP